MAPRRFRAITPRLREEMEKRGLDVTALRKGEEKARALRARQILKQRRKRLKKVKKDIKTPAKMTRLAKLRIGMDPT